MTWQPKASIQTLKARAALLSCIRNFFDSRDVLEVETPILSHSSGTDPYIDALTCQTNPISYLHTSPEFAMKRLLAANSGSIYQICKAFRAEEKSKLHNTEFTMLEWYRTGFDHHDLMDEMNDLLQAVLNCPHANKITYRDMFLQHTKLDPFHISIEELRNALPHFDIHLNSHDNMDQDSYLNLLLAQVIEPKLGFDKPLFIYDFPESQAALAKVRKGSPALASRFEVYINGIELANGFHELDDAKEQRHRFENDKAKRLSLNKSCPPIDEAFLQALEYGLPECAGVALGIDRLLMIQLGLTDINDVLVF